MTQQFTESELLELARKFSFRSRIDKNVVTGPIMVWGRGSVVRDVNGKEYLDFNSGQMCAALGHNHPRIVQALAGERGDAHPQPHEHVQRPEIILAARLAEISPEGMNRSMFLTSGSDSNEAAMAIAKRYTGGYEFASPAVSFHGMNDSTRAVTFSGWHEGYGPYAPGHYPIIAPYRYRCRFCQDRPACDYSCLDTSFELLDAQADGPLAAVITEPLFSAGGVIDLPPGWLAELKRRCEARGALLIVDEAQTGLAKLGTMWAFEQEGVVPDIFTISKHFGGGVAISAAITTDDIEEKASENWLGGWPFPLKRSDALPRRHRQHRHHLGGNADRRGPAHRGLLAGAPGEAGVEARNHRGHPGPGTVAGHRTGNRPRHPRTGLRRRAAR